jgi:hypothetical protein
MPTTLRRSLRSPIVIAFVFTFSGCVSSEVDPRATITSPQEYRDVVAQCVNASPFWQAYFDELESSAPGQPLVDD